MERKILVILTAVVVLMGTTIAIGAFAQNNRHRAITAGAVYAMTNAAAGNQIVVFNRDGDGMLTPAGSVATGGNGSGGGLDPLASQGSLVLTKDSRFLLAVNAASNTITVFRVKPAGIELADIVDSGGEFPVSITVFHDLVYVLNAGSNTICGFNMDYRGQLAARPGSTRNLGTGGFAQVGFAPGGDKLLVTDRDDSEILVFTMNKNGLPAPSPTVTPSNGVAPFGFIFDQQGHLLVVEAGSGAVSSYTVNDNGSLSVITPSVVNGQVAACWIAGNNMGYAFTANTGSQTISAYEGDNRGQIELLDATAGFGNRPIDMEISVNGRFLYALDPGSGTIDMFLIQSNGALIDLGTAGGDLEIFAQGIAVR